METAVVKTAPVKDEVVLKKRAAYANLGEKIHLAEVALQVQSQEAILSLKDLPSKIEDIAEAEAALKAFKSMRVQIEANRKKITGEFKPVIDRLMSYEKALEEPEKKYADAVLSLKKLHEAEEAKKFQVVEARKRLGEYVEKVLADSNHTSYEKVNTQVAVVFEVAIETDVTPLQIEQYVKEAEGKLSVIDFTVDKPKVNPVLLTDEEVNAIIQERWTYNPHAFVAVYRKALAERFADYGIAYQNKQVALEQARKEAEDKAQKLAEEKENAKIASELAAQSTVIEPDAVGPVVKAIKRSYAIDMLETPDNAIAIMAAFVANKQQCLNKLGRVSKWFSLTPTQMGNALAALKNDDNNFQPSGIKFREVEKL